jgi:hypothetical protein
VIREEGEGEGRHVDGFVPREAVWALSLGEVVSWRGEEVTFC